MDLEGTEGGAEDQRGRQACGLAVGHPPSFTAADGPLEGVNSRKLPKALVFADTQSTNPKAGPSGMNGVRGRVFFTPDPSPVKFEEGFALIFHRVQSSASLCELRILCSTSCDVGRRCSLNLAFLWLWCRRKVQPRFSL